MMFRHSCGWEINARILRLVTDNEDLGGHPMERLREIVRQEISQDTDLVWC